MEEDTLKQQAEATARTLGEVAQGQQVLRESMQRLEVRLRGAWLGHAQQEFEALKVRSSQPGWSGDRFPTKNSLLSLESQGISRSASQGHGL